MGGTSTDVCLVLDGQPAPAAEREVAGLPVRMPSLDVHTIGAGGGSIARLDAGGALVVGPRSAGAVPGPACYGRGGVEPTVTDADLAAGRIPAGSAFPGLGALDLDGRARRRSTAAGVDRRRRDRRGRRRHGAGHPGGHRRAGRRPRGPGPGRLRRGRAAARLRAGRGPRHGRGDRAGPGRGALRRGHPRRAPCRSTWCARCPTRSTTPGPRCRRPVERGREQLYRQFRGRPTPSVERRAGASVGGEDCRRRPTAIGPAPRGRPPRRHLRLPLRRAEPRAQRPPPAPVPPRAPAAQRLRAQGPPGRGRGPAGPGLGRLAGRSRPTCPRRTASGAVGPGGDRRARLHHLGARGLGGRARRRRCPRAAQGDVGDPRSTRPRCRC